MAADPSAARMPSDEDVKEGICSALSETYVDEIRPNKLRKIICKRVEGASWTQFQVNLESLIESGRIHVGKGGGGDRVILLKSSSKGGICSVNNEDAEAASAKRQKKSDVPPKSVDVQLPRAVALHLTRKAHLKQKNIEKNTKTKVLMGGKELKKKVLSAGSSDDEVTITISAGLNVGDNEQDPAEVDATIDRRLKSATVLINQMIKAYAKHPDRFAPRKAGGSFEEQAKEKKRKHDALQRRQAKNEKERNTSDQSTAKKRKRRKFY
mmetsp:Transcript_45261/g.137897  ORF Transcript_45261/g.137897 Transcript_45261/m.137897 type:complete len:267 (-) Transcript_45261:392-1192(-)